LNSFQFLSILGWSISAELDRKYELGGQGNVPFPRNRFLPGVSASGNLAGSLSIFINPSFFGVPPRAYPESHVFTHPALPNNFSAVMSNDTLDLFELVIFDYDLKRFSRRQYSET
jgi:hypothetical protein